MSIDTTILDARRAEVAQYDANIAMYQAVLSSLPTWDSAPDHLLQYRGAKNEHEIAGQIDDLNDVVLLSQLLYADTCRASIRSEIVERTKAASILAVLEAQANNP
jgi:hypothetical protein